MKEPKILIVEDGDSQRLLLRDFLMHEGYIVSEEEDGIKALQRIRGEHFDVILLDHKIPGISGLEVLKETTKNNLEIDVVIISAYGTLERAVEAMEEGAFSYITKPVELDKLLNILERITKRRAGSKNGKKKLLQLLGGVISLPKSGPYLKLEWGLQFVISNN